MARLRGIAGLIALAIWPTAATFGQDTVRHLFPAAGAPGTKVAVSVSGKFDPWPQEVWVSAPGVTFIPGSKAGSYDVEVASDAAPGPRLVRFHSPKGASPPRFFIVAESAGLLEAEPNDEFARPQKIAALPATVDGKLEKSGDVDSYAVTLRQGQTLVARAVAYELASTFDGMLRLVDERGAQLAFAHDSRTLDPLLAWTAPKDGTFIVQIMGFAYPATADVRFTGGEGGVYRLHLGVGPFVRAILPLRLPAGRKTQTHLIGWNLPAKSLEIEAPAGGTPPRLPEGFASDRPLEVSAGSEQVESEPNDAAAAANTLESGGAISGQIGRAGDVDRVAFAAVKGKSYELEITAARAGSALDAWLRIEAADGKELARGDDADGSRDPRLTWKAPADGTYLAVIGDLTQHGGEEYFYRLHIREAAPTIAATVTSHSASVAPGKSAELKVAVKRTNGFAPKLVLVAKDLPNGLTAAEVPVPDKDGEVTVKLEATAEAAPASQPFRLVLREVEAGVEHPVRHLLTTSSENNGVPQGYLSLVIGHTEQLWLTVAAPAK